MDPTRVLIVEDCADTASSTAAVLELWGMHAIVARSGRSAILQAAAAPPDVVLLDLGLPDMRGEDVARELRNHQCLDDTMIIVLSGYGSAHDQDKTFLAGCQLHLVKPVEMTQLHTVLIEGLREFRNYDPAQSCRVGIKS